MDILYFGTVCDEHRYMSLIEGCKTKPSIASIAFENTLLKGFELNCQNVEIHSFPPIPDFFKSGVLYVGNRCEKLPSNFKAKWIPTLNLPGFKQFTRFINCGRILRRWKREKSMAGSKCVIVYSLCPYIIPKIVQYCKKNRIICIAVVPDLLENMFINHNFGRIKSKIMDLYLLPGKAFMKDFDGYVYFTDQMREKFNCDARYTVIEGIADTDMQYLDNIASCRAVMYAGGMNENYGIRELIKVFLSIGDDSIELWLFGSGNMEKEIKRIAKLYSNIKYFGRVSREVVFSYEQRAGVLVNLRNNADDYTRYSFPSKIIEYMLSGTPVLTSHLSGIPKEYDDYLTYVDIYNPEDLKFKLLECLNCDSTMVEKGKNAREFVLKKKSEKAQVGVIIEMIESIEANQDA